MFPSNVLNLSAGNQGPYQSQPIDSASKGTVVVSIVTRVECINILYLFIYIFLHASVFFLLLMTTETAGLSFEPAPADLYSSETPYGTSALFRETNSTHKLEPVLVISVLLCTSVNGELPTPVAAATVEGQETPQYGQYRAAEGTSASLSAAFILMCRQTVLDLQKM